MPLFANEIRLARSAAWGLKGRSQCRSHRARQAGANGADGDAILVSRQHDIEFGALDGAAAFPRSFRTRVTLEPNCLVQNWAVKKIRGGSGNYNNWCFFGSLRALRLLRWTRSSFFCLTRTHRKEPRTALGTRGSEVVLPHSLFQSGCRGCWGRRPIGLLPVNAISSSKLLATAKIISWRFVERVLRSSSGSGGKRLV